jgi:quinol monooxygenase YgiN
MDQPVVRISRGSFDPASRPAIEDRLMDSRRTLVPSIRSLRGCLRYYAGIDPESQTMINVSVWATLEDAKQMDSLAPMLALAEELARLGVRFERPIRNFAVLWEI